MSPSGSSEARETRFPKKCISQSSERRSSSVSFDAEAASGVKRAGKNVLNLRYDWPDNGCRTFDATSFRIGGYFFLYTFLGAFFAGLARHRMRQSVF